MTGTQRIIGQLSLPYRERAPRSWWPCGCTGGGPSRERAAWARRGSPGRAACAPVA